MPQIVKFKDGMYGIRIGLDVRTYRFQDLNDFDHTWPVNHTYFDDNCKSNLKIVKKVFASVADPDHGEPI